MSDCGGQFHVILLYDVLKIVGHQMMLNLFLSQLMKVYGKKKKFMALGENV